MIDLSDHIDALKREVTSLGAADFDSISDEQWLGYLTDAFWEARLDGFLPKWTVDEDGFVTPEGGGEDLPRQYVALIILYAGIRILRNRIMSTTTTFKAQAGPVSFEQRASANVLAEMLRQLQAIKDRLLDQADQGTVAYLVDGYTVRQWAPDAYYGNILADIYAGVS